MSYVPTDHRLNNISSVKAVHAVSANVSLLTINDLTCAICDFLSLVHAKLELSDEMIICVKLLLDHVNKLREVLPLHLTAFMMKIEPDILDLFILNFINDVGKCVSNALLRALLVNKVYEDLLAKLLLDLSHMLDGENSGILSILVNADRRAPLHSGLLAP